MPLRLALMLALVVAAAGLTVALGAVMIGAFGGHRAEGIGTVLGLGLVVALVARLLLVRRGGGK